MSREILAHFPAGGPRGSRPAEEKAQQLTSQGLPAKVVMDLPSDRFLAVRAES